MSTTYDVKIAGVKDLSAQPASVAGSDVEQRRDVDQYQEGDQLQEGDQHQDGEHRYVGDGDTAADGVPGEPDWCDEAWPVLSPVPAALGRIAHGMYALGLPAEVTDDLLALLACAAAHLPSAEPACNDSTLQTDVPAADPAASDPDSSDTSASSRFPIPGEDAITHTELLDAAAAVRRVQGFAESVAVSASRSLAHRAGLLLLKQKRVAVPQELSATARARWRARTKSVVAQELSVLTGHTLWRCRSLVAFAAAPRAAAAPVEQALRAGVTEWRAVELWWSRCRSMPVDDAAAVAEAVFTPLLTEPVPDEPAAGRDAKRSPRQESWGEFKRRLDREVMRVQGKDAAAARARRAAAVETRNVRVEICDDGLGCISISGATAAVVGATDRLETIARKARAAGDDRPLHQIRADSALALLVHGVLPLPGVTATAPAQPARPDAPSGPGQDDLDPPLVDTPDDVLRIIQGLPATTVELILPLSAVIPGFPPHGADHRRTGSRGAAERRRAGGEHAAVAEIAGHCFITPEHGRELTLMPGTTLHRLVTDPVDGRVVERSIAAYRPDQRMVDQVRAADRHCRAPGCLVPAARCDLDHEHPRADGGPTAETNLGLKHRAHHALKTEGFWHTVMDSTRTVTWRTLFGRIYPTRAHDYRQYEGSADDRGRSTVKGSRDATDPWGGLDPGGVGDRDLQHRLVYAALSSRHGQDSWLEALDDHDEYGHSWVRGVDRPLTVFHRVGGRRRSGPPPGQPTPEAVLNPEPVTPRSSPWASRPHPGPPPF